MPHILYAGKLSWGKGPHIVIEALPMVEQLMRPLPVYLRLCGDGDLRKHLEARAEELGVLAMCHFAGQVPHKELQYMMRQWADVVVVPSIFQEPFGRVALEALNAGCPVVCSDRGGLPEIVDDGRTGYVVHIETTLTHREPVGALERDARAFAQAIVKVLRERVIVIQEDA